MRILFICTGNRCRSQMAQAILQNLDKTLIVCSAGTKPAKEVHPLAIQIMNEVSIDMSNHYPKNIDRYIDDKWDFVITVCDGAKESCPVFHGNVGERLHIGFEDPDKFEGTEEEVLEQFRRVRNEISQRIQSFYETKIMKNK